MDANAAMTDVGPGLSKGRSGERDPDGPIAAPGI